MEFYWLALGVLAVWRLTHLLHAEDGPWDLFERLRRALGETAGGQLLDCFYCLSLWIALPAAWLLGEDLKHRMILWLALSAGAILVERLSAGFEAVPATYVEDGGTDDALLRPPNETPPHPGA